MKQPQIVIVDHGFANIFNLQAAFRKVGANVIVASKPEDVRRATRLALPGVGSFSEAMKRLRSSGLADEVVAAAKAGKPILGVCLGYQLLFSSSEENGRAEGLNLIEGEVRHLRQKISDRYFKVPHVGWNTLGSEISDRWQSGLLKSLKNGDEVYFSHSYFADLKNRSEIAAESRYGNFAFCAVAQKDNVMGCQFHPEKSGELGHRILENFMRLE